MKILHACSEFYPLLKTGGLADVTGALPLAQRKLGIDARVLLPGYSVILNSLTNFIVVKKVDTFAGCIEILYSEYKTLPIYVIKAPWLYEREGNPYYDGYYNDYTDNYKRFALLGWVAAEFATGLDPIWSAEIIHAHDWHAGLTSAYLKTKGNPAKSIFTIHNLAYTGSFDYKHIFEIWLPIEMFSVDGLEFYGQISYLKAGIYYSDYVTTVSPTYAKGITTAEFACGFEGILSARHQAGRLVGILNGVDYDIWNPAKDNNITAKYSIDTLVTKQQNKLTLQKMFELTESTDAPMFIVVSRLTYQKGIDLLSNVMDKILDNNGQFVLLGSGESNLEHEFLALQQKYPKQVGIKIGYDEELSHLMMAAGDVITIPSRFEPCGLTQLYGLKYGTLPLVSATGGLEDSVTDTNADTILNTKATGFKFSIYNLATLNDKIEQIFATYQDKSLWSKLMKNAMSQNFSWHSAAEQYYELYKQLTH